MRLASIASVILAFVVAGCDAGQAGRTPAPTSVPPRGVQLVGDGAVFDPEAVTGYAFMLPGAVVAAGEAAHAWVVGFGEQRGDQELMRLVAPADGTEWRVADRRVEDGMGLDLSPPGPIPSTVLTTEAGGDWVMYFSGNANGMVGADIWRAMARDPGGPWTADPEPVLARADVPTAELTEAFQLDFPAVVATGDGYLMLFGWSPSRDMTVIRSATSTDGISWTVADDPAIDLGLCGGFDTRSVAMPRVGAHPDGGWLALYGGFGAGSDESMALGMARSTDGATWTCASSEPILDVGDIPGSTRIHSYALLAADGALPRLLIESLVEDRSELWLAQVGGGEVR